MLKFKLEESTSSLLTLLSSWWYTDSANSGIQVHKIRVRVGETQKKYVSKIFTWYSEHKKLLDRHLLFYHFKLIFAKYFGRKFSFLHNKRHLMWMHFLMHYHSHNFKSFHSSFFRIVLCLKDPQTGSSSQDVVFVKCKEPWRSLSKR